MTTVSTRKLPGLGALVAVPGYDRGRVTVGVVHLGVGGFHRAHQARYLDRLMDATGQLEWGICGVGVLPADRAMQAALEAQDHLYTLVEKRGDDQEEARIVGSIVEYLLAPDDPDAVVERMASEAVRIVSLTITEGGYAIDPADPAVEGAGVLGTAFGLISEGLHRRRERGLRPFAVVSCDNLEGNGRLTRDRVVAFARRRDPAFAGWVEREVRFPSSMVDRITTRTTEEDRAQLADRYGIEDRWPVVSEPYTQWVLEDDFPAGRPPLEAVGVQMVEDVRPYELMKLRLLNGSHQVLGYLAYLAGYRLVHDAAGDPLFRALLLGYMEEEAAPTLPPVPGIDLAEYRQTLVERFSNPALDDTLARLCAYSSDRIPQWLFPIIRRQLAAGGSIRRCATAVAAWARYAEGVDEAGEPITLVDALSDQLSERARRQRAEPRAFLEDRALFGDLADDSRFVAAYEAALTSLHQRGARATVESLVASAETQDEAPGRVHG